MSQRTTFRVNFFNFFFIFVNGYPCHTYLLICFCFIDFFPFAEFAMANVTCEYDSSNSQNMDGSAPGRRIRRSETLLRQAAECVSHGQTFQTVSDMFHIPISTIR